MPTDEQDELSRLRDTDNGPKPEDGTQEGVPQDPDVEVLGDADEEPEDVAAMAAVIGELEAATAAASVTVTADKVLAKCRSQLGAGEHPDGSNHNKYTVWYGIGNGPWCDMFQGWCDNQVGGATWLGRAGRYAYTPWHAEFYQRVKRWGHTPRKGAFVYYAWSGKKTIGAIEHIERVEAVNADGSFYTIGGNVSNRVKRIRRSMVYVVGFGYPPYASSGSSPSKPKPASGVKPWPGRYLQHASPMQHGSDVKWIQQRLNTKAKAKLATDSYYGPKTIAAVRKYQKAHKLAQDGIVGPKTWASLAAK